MFKVKACTNVYLPFSSAAPVLKVYPKNRNVFSNVCQLNIQLPSKDIFSSFLKRNIFTI